MTKRFKKRAEADMGLIFTSYNLRRLINILGIKALGEYMKALAVIFYSFFSAIRLNIRHFKRGYFFGRFLSRFLRIS